MFDRYVADKKRRRPLLYMAFLASTVLEAGLIVFFIIYSILHVEEVQPPLLTVTFINAAAPPPPPPPPPKGSTKPKTPKIPKPVVQPTEVPKIIQPKEKEPEEDKDEGGGEAGGVEGGVAGGVAGGVIGGVVGGVAGGPPPPQKPVNKPAFLIKKDKLSGEMPHLPEVIKAQRRGSTVLGTYKICIDSSGKVNSVNPVSSIPGADDQIIASLRTWTFKPQPIPVCFIDAFQFIIE